MTEKAQELRREYKREWNRKNKDKVRDAQNRYWERRAAEKTKTDEPNKQEV